MDKLVWKIKYELTNYRELKKSYSFSLALYCLIYNLSGYLKLRKITKWAFDKKSKIINTYFESNYSDIIEKYKYEDTFLQEVKEEEYPIWFLWYEGIEEMPDLIKANYNKLKKLNDGINQVILITKDNIDDYIDIPEEIKNKAGRQLSYSHFSDLIRAMLLAKYGGCWIDSTCFCTKPITEGVKDRQFFSCRTNGCDLQLPANSEWVTWFQASNKVGYKLFRFSQEMQLAFWKKEDWVIDYLYHDYIIRCAYNHFPDIKKDIDSLPENNTDRSLMMYKMGEEYNDSLYKSKTWVYKLSYKKKYPLQVNGKDTYYGKLMKNEL